MLRYRLLLFVAVLTLCTAHRASAQQVSSPPGQFDYYLLSMSWSPEFCDTLSTLTPEERTRRSGTECSAPHGFVLHGLWPQNDNGTYPANCGSRPGPRTWKRYLDMTPDESLLRHEWAKHGTCTTLSPDAFFSTARQAYTSIGIPAMFQHLSTAVTLQPSSILAMFYAANPGFPQGSFTLACSHNRLTAVAACFSKDVQPIACQKVPSCHAGTVLIAPDGAGQIVE